ncbi:hypothetical protein M9980_13430 [Sphingomonas donggukensis]|uniref:Uncharacterized protein n=1 Tax=Sphingomonas donggukensis TaxID=2949093 RepID=A0ABY4TT62_9SPHN|nr:hypothetical protein [Sphingomonas donggukensis]URW75513.1 hypothetical protein M9980_13430 [Sphingomonas donggukensis]
MFIDDPFALPVPYLSDRATLTDADALIATYGDDAGYEAASRADHGRDQGNAVSFARWRQVERLIAFLASDEAVGTVH